MYTPRNRCRIKLKEFYVQREREKEQHSLRSHNENPKRKLFRVSLFPASFKIKRHIWYAQNYLKVYIYSKVRIQRMIYKYSVLPFMLKHHY